MAPAPPGEDKLSHASVIIILAVDDEELFPQSQRRADAATANVCSAVRAGELEGVADPAVAVGRDEVERGRGTEVDAGFASHLRDIEVPAGSLAFASRRSGGPTAGRRFSNEDRYK